MEITKDIYLNTDNLAKTSEFTLIYKGDLTNSDETYIYYGYSPNTFEYVKEKLNKVNESLQIEIKLSKPGYFYFYFKDDQGNIDNNYHRDYQLYIKQSNLILTENSSMKELPYKNILDFSESPSKTFYTTQTIKNTSRPQEIIIPRAFNISSATPSTKNVVGYTVEPVKEIKHYDITQALIPTDHLSLITTTPKDTFGRLNRAINKILLLIPRLFGKNYS